MKLNKVPQRGISNQIAHCPRRLMQHRQHARHGVFAALIAMGMDTFRFSGGTAMPGK